MAKHTAPTERQRRAVVLRVEDNLNNSQIARQIGVSPQAVSAWFRKPQVRRELTRQGERYEGDSLPELIQSFQEIRKITVGKLRAKLEGEMTIKEATEVIKTMTASLESEFSKLESIRQISREDAADASHSLMDALDADEGSALAYRSAALEKDGNIARRLGHMRLRLIDPATTVPITFDSDGIQVFE